MLRRILPKNCHRSSWSQGHTLDVTKPINVKSAAHPEKVTDETQQAVGAPSGIYGRHSMAKPNENIVCELSQKHQHFLGRKTPLVALIEAQSLLAFTNTCLDTAAATVIGMKKSPHRLVCCRQLAGGWLLCQPTQRLGRQGCDQDTVLQHGKDLCSICKDDGSVQGPD